MTRAAEMAKIVGKGSVDIHGEAGTTSSGSTGLTTNLQQGLVKQWVRTSTASVTELRRLRTPLLVQTLCNARKFPATVKKEKQGQNANKK